ncbi:protein translocase subunit SecD [Solidesulfovibrio carbinolicus]|uniref:Protein translocase subunit SecD n=1 Tax=Solidesulfovibrio carbinolicus TaxID=296842 RepID=A0A4P6HNP5_9BACT|nr:protein translocase subunit SecD [Solidesulfovibrio carbinolicus]QAZ67670.1 protein translocase subunit SecD [Solidesulfovibrio carbinolicus]
MTGNLRWRLAVISLVAFLGLIYMLPSLGSVKQSFLGKFLPDDVVSLGLDLKGGIHLTLGVDVDKALANSLAQMGRDVRDQVKDEGIVIQRPGTSPDGKRLEFVLATPDKRDALDTFLSSHFSVLHVDGVESAADNKLLYKLSFTQRYKDDQARMTVDQAVKTIRNRIDEFGVAEPDIRKQADNRIQIQLPGLQDPERAIKLIGKTAHLEFKVVDETVDMEKAQKGILPPGDELSVLRHRNPDGSYLERPIALKADAVMTGESIADARANFDPNNQAYVALTFTPSGARQFERVTAENVKKQLAIVLDGKVYSAPTIQEKIGGGRASITGRFSTEEARDLAIVLRAGALPAPVTILEQRTVGPSLGQESIEKGVHSAVIGGLIVIAFMIVYYGVAGAVADAALLFNLVLIMAGLAGFGATLTLPGIAGIILTIGMAVDANVIIFERIREELRRGLTARSAVDVGYSRATLTILDANVTTVIAAVVLYQFGTGPIRGFAVTLILGIVASMFTAIFFTRFLFDLWLSKRPADAGMRI